MKNMKKKMKRMARKETIMVAELPDEAPEREKVVTRILTRSKETIGKLSTVKTTLSSKVTEYQTSITTFKSSISTMTTKITEINTKVISWQEKLKILLADRW